MEARQNLRNFCYDIARYRARATEGTSNDTEQPGALDLLNDVEWIKQIVWARETGMLQPMDMWQLAFVPDTIQHDLRQLDRQINRQMGFLNEELEAEAARKHARQQAANSAAQRPGKQYRKPPRNYRNSSRRH